MLCCEELSERQEGGGRRADDVDYSECGHGHSMHMCGGQRMLCSEYLGERQEGGGQRADDGHCVCMRAVSVGRGIQCTFTGVRG